MADFNSDKIDLFKDFSPSTKENWENLALADLGPEKDLSDISWKLRGLGHIHPLYTRQEVDHGSTEPLPINRKWALCEPVIDTNLADAISSIQKAANGGADACLISQNIPTRNEEDLLKLTAVAEKSNIRLIIEMDGTTDVTQIKTADSELLTFLLDPYSDGSLVNKSTATAETLFDVDGAAYCEKSASIPHQLAVSLSMASEILLATELKGAESIQFRIKTSPLYFPEIAKIRALRILWHNLLDSYHLKNKPGVRIFSEIEQDPAAETPYNNLILSVSKAMCAVLGGADMILIHPFDASLQFSRRITRNIQHILRDEAHFGKVADPAAGSYYIEKLTDEIAEKAWKIFGQIENNSGFSSSLKNGLIPEELT